MTASESNAELVAVGVFTFRDFDGRWYIGAEWHYATDSDVPARIVMVPASCVCLIDAVESLFNAGGFASEADAIAAILATEIN